MGNINVDFFNLVQWFRRIRCFKIKFTDDERLTHDGRQPITIAHLELKKEEKKFFVLLNVHTSCGYDAEGSALYWKSKGPEFPS